MATSEHGDGEYDLIAVGGGPAGYAAALYGAAAGLSVALVESDKVGGTCLHRGCIPAKELLHTATVLRTVSRASEFGIGVQGTRLDFGASQVRKARVVDELFRGLESLLASRKVTVVSGFGRLSARGVVAVGRDAEPGSELRASHVVLATGSAPKAIPGLEPDGELVLDSDHVLELSAIPASVAVIGGGAIGCEFASMFCDLGARVTLVELTPALLPGADREVARVVERAFTKRGIEVRTGVGVRGAKRVAAGVSISLDDGSEIESAVAVVAVGRRPRSEGLLDEATGVAVDDRGYVRVDEWMRTGTEGVFAVGDLVDTPQLAHVGFAEAILVVKQILGEPAEPVDYGKIPWCIYSEPEVAFAGMTEDGARRSGRDVVVVKDSFSGNARARIIGETDGFVKVVAERGSDGAPGPVLGVHMVGPWVSEQLGQAYLALNWGAAPAELAGLIQPHPTLSEGYGEALMALAGRGLHLDAPR
ncbi:MAG: lpd [Acidimicrobiaceae bacterium]|nr:lpd [Acidimicrobiaceae bacterium]